ncbi:MAG: SpoIIE family protein phosphatase [Lachnospiraceae bacterium]|nr:SpoIIE family protein phosphatase [Lachnospiraceae bacterium]
MKEKIKKKKKRSLALQFGILFVIVAIVTIFINGYVTYLNQRKSYNEQCLENLDQISKHFTDRIISEEPDFREFVEWFIDNREKIQILPSFRRDLKYTEISFYSYMRVNYPEMYETQDFSFSKLDEDGKIYYATYRLSYWMSVFADIIREFDLSYAYFICPVPGEENTVVYMIDPSTTIPDNDKDSEFLVIGDKVYEDPKEHKYMWKTWEEGKSLLKADSVDNKYGFMYTYCYPVRSKGKLVGMLCVDKDVVSVTDVIVFSVIRQGIVTAFIFVVATMVLFACIRRFILWRIEGLQDDVEKYSENKDPAMAEEIKKRGGRNDEISTLSDKFSEMITSLDDYMKNLQHVTAEKEKISAELNVATQIQADMLPRVFPGFPEEEKYEIFATMDPAKEVGGDFYDFFMVDQDHLALVIADVSGKGVPAALFMVIAKTLIKNRLQMGETPSEALEHVNEQLCEGNDAELFVTVWIALIDLKTGHALEVNAGHERPAIRRKNGNYEMIRTKHSPAVAVMEGMTFRQTEFDLEPGDSIFVYTDGVTEATNKDEQLFGEERLNEALNRYAGLKPGALLPEITKEIDGFVGEAPQFDDITMLGMIYYGNDRDKFV